MERVTGIGGVFVRGRDPAALNRWYAAHLGVDSDPASYDGPPWRHRTGNVIQLWEPAGADLRGPD